MRFTEDAFAAHMRPISGSAIRDIFKLLGRPGMISFAGGNPGYDVLEPDVVRELADEALSSSGKAILQYGATDGWAPLLESAAAFLEKDGVVTGGRVLLPTQGSSQAIDLVLKAMVEPGDAVLAESPTFLGALQAMHTYNARVIPMETDEDGVIPGSAEEMIRKHRPKVMYVIPTFQNPSGRTLGIERRRALARLACEYGVVLIEDDPYRDLRYSGEPMPPIQSFDEEGWVVYLASFSKYVSPGLRVGCAVANPVLARKLVIGKQSADTHSPLLNQAIIDLYLRHGLMDAHIARLCDFYRVQRDAMLEKMPLLPEGTTWTKPDGGLFVWAELPERIDAAAALNACVENNVAYVPGTHFYPEGGHMNTLRLNFSMPTVSAISAGMEKLASVLKQY